MKIERIKRIRPGRLIMSTRKICTLPVGEIIDFPTDRCGLKGVKPEEMDSLIKQGFFVSVEKPVKVSGSKIPKKD